MNSRDLTLNGRPLSDFDPAQKVIALRHANTLLEWLYVDNYNKAKAWRAGTVTKPVHRPYNPKSPGAITEDGTVDPGAVVGIKNRGGPDDIYLWANVNVPPLHGLLPETTELRITRDGYNVFQDTVKGYKLEGILYRYVTTPSLGWVLRFWEKPESKAGVSYAKNRNHTWSTVQIGLLLLDQAKTIEKL